MSAKDKEEDTNDAALFWRGTITHCRPVKNGVDDEKIITMRVFTVGLDSIERISAVRIFTPQAMQTPEARKKVSLSVKEVQKRFPEGIPLLDPVKDLGIEEDSFKTLIDRAEALTKRLVAHKLTTDFTDEDRIKLVQAYEKKVYLKEQLQIPSMQ